MGAAHVPLVSTLMLIMSRLSFGSLLAGAPNMQRLLPTLAPRSRLFMANSKPLATAGELASLTVPQLKAELVKRGLPVSGKKAVLIERLSAQIRPPRNGKAKVSSGAPSSRRSAKPASPQGMSVTRSDGPAVMVVESPAKCATIAKFAGDDTIVLASYGHVRALPSKANSVRPSEDFAMDFEVASGAGSVLKSLGTALRSSRALLLATDPDREGEAIAWHVLEALREKGLLPAHIPVHRVTFSEITPKAVQAALANPRAINMPLVRAQQARQAVDYLVGFSLSPVLWRKLPGCKSAGRVQSVALRVITEREHEIARFEPQEWWDLKARVLPADAARRAEGTDGATDDDEPPMGSLVAAVTHLQGQRVRQFDLGSEEATAEAAALLPEAWRVDQVKRSQRQSGPAAPYNTASLQQDASRRLGLAVGRVMRLAQSLYEGVPLGGGEPVALITYMRTDGVQMSEDGIEGARAYIASAFGSGTDFLLSEPRQFKRKARNAQEAHEAIRPVDMMRTPASLRGRLADAELRLYELIWRRAVGSQMANAVFEQLAITMHPAGTIEGDVPTAVARAAGSRLLLPGHKILRQQPSAVPPRSQVDADEDEDEAMDNEESELGVTTGEEEPQEEDARLNLLLERIGEGDILSTAELLPAQHFTEPPPRFSEGSLVRCAASHPMVTRVVVATCDSCLAVRRPPPRPQCLAPLLCTMRTNP